MGNNSESDAAWNTTWTERMGQIAECELPYDEALETALRCVKVADGASRSLPPLSPADSDARLDINARLASSLECEVRLAVYSLYHGDALVKHAEAVSQLLECGRRADLPG
jgi:hypothetical protein